MTDTADSGLTEAVGELIDALAGRGETIATAESITGGMLGGRLTSVAGSSRVYRGGVISYATDLKATLAGVSERTLSEHGAVSALTAVEMALGVAARCEASWGLAVTGVAGPDAQEGHQPGTVFAAVARASSSPAWDEQADSDVCVRELHLVGTRQEIRDQTVREVLTQASRVCLG